MAIRIYHSTGREGESSLVKWVPTRSGRTPSTREGEDQSKSTASVLIKAMSRLKEVWCGSLEDLLTNQEVESGAQMDGSAHAASIHELLIAGYRQGMSNGMM